MPTKQFDDAARHYVFNETGILAVSVGILYNSYTITFTPGEKLERNESLARLLEDEKLEKWGSALRRLVLQLYVCVQPTASSPNLPSSI
jgi:hypothetical protein